MGSKIGFVFSMLLTSIFLIASLALILFWILMYGGGFSWDDYVSHPKLHQFRLKFNFHPSLMIGGFIFFSGFSMLFYRLMTCCRKLIVKLLHTIFHSLAIACIAIGFLTIWESHESAFPKIPHFYSLHSWLGLATMGLFAIQFVVGFFSFLVLLCCEGGTAACRASLIPTHSTFGIITFIMACITAIIGLTETAFYSLNTPLTNYRGYEHWVSDEAIFINVLGAVLAAAAISMFFTINARAGRRKQMRMAYHTDL